MGKGSVLSLSNMQMKIKAVPRKWGIVCLPRIFFPLNSKSTIKQKAHASPHEAIPEVHQMIEASFGPSHRALKCPQSKAPNLMS